MFPVENIILDLFRVHQKIHPLQVLLEFPIIYVRLFVDIRGEVAHFKNVFPGRGVRPVVAVGDGFVPRQKLARRRVMHPKQRHFELKIAIFIAHFQQRRNAEYPVAQGSSFCVEEPGFLDAEPFYVLPAHFIFHHFYFFQACDDVIGDNRVRFVQFALNENVINVTGVDKQIVGNIASKIRAVRPPDPYKAKGIKYEGEKVRRKAGKAAKTAAA